MKVTFETEDGFEIQCFINSTKMYSSISEARAFIRNKIKHDDISDETEKILEGLMEILYIGDFDS